MLRAATRPQGNRAGQGCQSMVPRLRVSYWGDWAEMRTSWALGFTVKVREGGGVLNRVFFSPPDGDSPSRDGGEFGACPLLRVVLRVGSARVWGMGPWLPSDSPGCTGGQWGPLTSAGRQECRLHTSSPQEELSEDICEFVEDHIQENLPVSWSHCLRAFLPLPTGLSCPWGCCVYTELPGVGDELGGGSLKSQVVQFCRHQPPHSAHGGQSPGLSFLL